MGDAEGRFSFVDLPEKAYPFTIDAIDVDGKVVWSETVKEPCALEVPPLITEFGPVGIRITYADGLVTETGPPSLEDD